MKNKELKKEIFELIDNYVEECIDEKIYDKTKFSLDISTNGIIMDMGGELEFEPIFLYDLIKTHPCKWSKEEWKEHFNDLVDETFD